MDIMKKTIFCSHFPENTKIEKMSKNVEVQVIVNVGRIYSSTNS